MKKKHGSFGDDQMTTFCCFMNTKSLCFEAPRLDARAFVFFLCFLQVTVRYEKMGMIEENNEVEIDKLPCDILSNIFILLSSFRDLAQASSVCRKWRQGVKQSLARRHSLSFAGWKMDDNSTARIVHDSYGLKELDISRSCWGCQITDDGLYKISLAKCVSNLTSISLWGITGISDKGVTQLVSRAISLQHLNIGGTFITDDSLFAIASSCPNLKTIVLWSCRHVTEGGLLVLVNECRKLESINVWGMRVPVECFHNLITISPALQIKPPVINLNLQRPSIWPLS